MNRRGEPCGNKSVFVFGRIRRLEDEANSSTERILLPLRQLVVTYAGWWKDCNADGPFNREERVDQLVAAVCMENA